MTAIIPVRRRGLSPQGTVPESVWVVILAAGASRRFGRAKLLVRQGPVTLLERSVRLGQAIAGPRCIVVLGARASRLAAALPSPPPVIVVNRRWREGMSTSLAEGLRALPSSARAALVLLADQYALQPADLARLLAAHRRRPASVVAAGWGGLPGPPVLLPRRLFKAARALAGDEGARRLLRTPGACLHVEPLASAALDLDAPGDRAAARFRRARLLGAAPSVAWAPRHCPYPHSNS